MSAFSQAYKVLFTIFIKSFSSFSILYRQFSMIYDEKRNCDFSQNIASLNLTLHKSTLINLLFSEKRDWDIFIIFSVIKFWRLKWIIPPRDIFLIFVFPIKSLRKKKYNAITLGPNLLKTYLWSDCHVYILHEALRLRAWCWISWFSRKPEAVKVQLAVSQDHSRIYRLANLLK